MSEKNECSSSELNDLLKQTFIGDTPIEYTLVDNFFLLTKFLEKKEIYNNLEVDDEDIWICGFPKSGTTWISEIAWLVANNLDYEGAKEDEHARTAIIDMAFLFDPEYAKKFDSRDCGVDPVKYCQTMKAPRSIKSHLPFCFLPEQIKNRSKRPRIIYIARHPMDVCVSYYFQSVNYENYKGNIDDFCKLFVNHKLNYCPWFEHVVSFWNMRLTHNILFVTYEEMSKNIRLVIQKVANFLKKELTDEEVDRLIDHTSFTKMKVNRALNKSNINEKFIENGGTISTPFIREGKTKNYKKYISEEYTKLFETAIENWHKKTGIDFNKIEEVIFSNN